jgi:carnitine O-acetyltransferase
LHFDATGKVELHHLYVRDDPRAYFLALDELGYRIPQEAKPWFARLVREYRAATGVEAPTVVDVGCSYGVNAALLRCDAGLDELYRRYADPAARSLDRGRLLDRDRAFVRTRGRSEGAAGPVRFVGLDNSGPALAYARAAGFLDDAVHADLEHHDATPGQRAVLATADLVVSTGCVGYVGERTLRQVAQAHPDRRPWMAHFVLRMFPYGPVADSLRPLGYETVPVEGLHRQRRFASPREQAQVVARLRDAGVDPDGLEADGWLYAQLHLSLPSDALASATADLSEARR